MPCDMVLVAIGEAPDPSFLPEGTSVEVTAWGGLLDQPGDAGDRRPGRLCRGRRHLWPQDDYSCRRARQAGGALHSRLPAQLSPTADRRDCRRMSSRRPPRCPPDGVVTLDLRPTPREVMPLAHGEAAHDRTLEFAAGLDAKNRRGARPAAACAAIWPTSVPTVKVVGGNVESRAVAERRVSVDPGLSEHIRS